MEQEGGALLKLKLTSIEGYKPINPPTKSIKG